LKSGLNEFVFENPSSHLKFKTTASWWVIFRLRSFLSSSFKNLSFVCVSFRPFL
jgi:hypothetical protein